MGALSSSSVSETARHSVRTSYNFLPAPARRHPLSLPRQSSRTPPFPRHRPRDLTAGPLFSLPDLLSSLLPPLPPTTRETFFFLAESAARKIFKASFGRFVSRRTTREARSGGGVVARSLRSRRPLAHFSFCPVARDDAIIVGTAARRPRKITIIPP